jgi:short-subunit dehydrogenase
LTIDLTSENAAAKILEGITDLQIGFFVYCAGADSDYRHFLDNTLESAESIVHRNCTVPMQLCYHLGGPMSERGRGAIVILGSGAGLAGAANMAAYAASKSFDMIFAEALWCELEPKGVDVLGLILGNTDTPALRRLREERGLAPVKSADSPQKVVEDALAHLTKGPTRFVNKQLRWGARLMKLFSRKRIVMMMNRAAAKTMRS